MTGEASNGLDVGASEDEARIRIFGTRSRRPSSLACVNAAPVIFQPSEVGKAGAYVRRSPRASESNVLPTTNDTILPLSRMQSSIQTRNGAGLGKNRGRSGG